MKKTKIEYKRVVDGVEKRYNIVLEQDDNFYELKCKTKDNRIMGYVTFKIYDDCVWINKIETKEKYQHRGVANALIELVEYFSMTNRKQKIEAKYHPTNDFAKPFYQKHGYFIPNQSGTWEDYDETWRMYKDLNFNLIDKNIVPNITFIDPIENDEENE